MARFDEETSNALFDVLTDWESLLKAENINIPKILNDAESRDKKTDNSAPQSKLNKAFQPKKPEIKPKPLSTDKAAQRTRGLSR